MNKTSIISSILIILAIINLTAYADTVSIEARNETIGVFPGETFCIFRNITGSNLTFSSLYSKDVTLVSVDLVTVKSRVESYNELYSESYTITDIIVDNNSAEKTCLMGKNCSWKKAVLGEGGASEGICSCTVITDSTCTKTRRVNRTIVYNDYSPVTKESFIKPSTDGVEGEVNAESSLTSSASTESKKVSEVRDSITKAPEKLKKFEKISYIENVETNQYRFCYKAPTLDEIRLKTKNPSGEISFALYNNEKADYETTIIWNATWLNYLNVTINTNVTEPLTNFPAYTRVDTTQLIANGLMKPDCSDIRIVNDNFTTLSREIENTTCNTNGTVVYFRIPKTNMTNMQYYLFFNNNDSVDTTNTSDVWLNYGRVYHMSDLSDSTGQDSGLTTYGSPTLVTGLRGKAYQFDTDSLISYYNFSNAPTAISFWYLPQADSEEVTLVSAYSGAANYNYESLYSEGTYTYSRWANNAGQEIMTWSGSPYPYRYFFVGGSTDANTNSKIFFEGKTVLNSSSLVNATGNIGQTHIGGNYLHQAQRMFVGIIDELRISEINRSDAWNKAEYQQTYYVSGINNNTNPIGELTACSILGVANTYYNLTQNVSASGSCFNITANNVTLDCMGYTINYSQTETGFAVNNTLGYDYLTIKNCNIIQSSSISSSQGIRATGSDNLTIINNNITTFGADSYAIYSHALHLFANISSNIIHTNGTSGIGIWDSSGRNDSIINNSCDTNGTSAVGIYLSTTHKTNTSRNYLFSLGSSVCGLYPQNSYDNNIVSNTIISADGSSRGICTYSTDNLTIDKNLIYSNGSYGYGIYLTTTTNNSLITNNNVSTIGQNGYGIFIHTSNNNTITSNIIDTTGIDSYSIYFIAGENNSIYNNFLNSTTQQNVYFNSSTSVNYWNTSNQSGTRIYGNGTLLGGNYYASSIGNGYSEICEDNNTDYFCDLAYNLTTNSSCSGPTCGNNTDYLAYSSGITTTTTTTTTSTSTTPSSTTTTTIVETSNSTAYEYSIMIPVFAFILTIAAFHFSTIGNINSDKTGIKQPLVPVMATIFWLASAMMCTRIRHIGNFTISGATYYIDRGNPEIGGLYLFAAACMFIYSLMVILESISMLRAAGGTKK
jgi:hypothetical protein